MKMLKTNKDGEGQNDNIRSKGGPARQEVQRNPDPDPNPRLDANLEKSGGKRAPPVGAARNGSQSRRSLAPEAEVCSEFAAGVPSCSLERLFSSVLTWNTGSSRPSPGSRVSTTAARRRTET